MISCMISCMISLARAYAMNKYAMNMSDETSHMRVRSGFWTRLVRTAQHRQELVLERLAARFLGSEARHPTYTREDTHRRRRC